MAIVVMKRPKMGLLQRIYLFEIFRGLVITLRHVFQRRWTLEYPEKKWELPRKYRGAPVLLTGMDGRQKCVACQMCEFACPADAISMVPGETGNEIEKYPVEFNIDMGLCIFCGYCQEACPEEAIWLKSEYDLADYNRDDLIFNKEKLLSMGRCEPFLEGTELPLNLDPENVRSQQDNPQP